MKIIIEGLDDNKAIDEITIDDSYSYIKERLKTLIETNGFDSIRKLVNFIDNFLQKDPKVRKNLDQLIHEFLNYFLINQNLNLQDLYFLHRYIMNLLILKLLRIVIGKFWVSVFL